MSTFQFKNKNILIVSPEPWDHVFVSKHHYSTYLAKRDNHVFFLNPPSTRYFCKPTDFRNVSSVQYRGFVRGMRLFPGFLRRFFTRYTFRRLEKVCHCRFDVIWSFDNSTWYDLDALPQPILTISHIVDLNQDFETERAASTADFCFCTTDLIRDRLLKFRLNVSKINHGFNADALVDIPSRTKRDRITAIYSGNLAMPYIDWIAIEGMVKLRPDVDFVFVGPNSHRIPTEPRLAAAKAKVLQAGNVAFTGMINSSELQVQYRAADVLLISYLELHHNEQANPHKMMEYLGSGNVIVSSFTSEYASLVPKELILMPRKNEDLPQLFALACDNLPSLNRDVLRKERIQFAITNTYDRQIEKIESIIENSR